MHAHTHAHKYTHMHTNTRTHTHTHMHTHTNTHAHTKPMYRHFYSTAFLKCLLSQTGITAYHMGILKSVETGSL